MSSPFYRSSLWRALRDAALERDGYACTVKGCPHTRATSRLYVDHIVERPYAAYLTSADVLTNLRTLCTAHDQQVRQDRQGKRRNGGRFVVAGCDANGLPLDPGHHWRAR